MSQEAKLKHLEMIQAVINRMANNSFLLKGWSVTLTAALFALAAKGSNEDLILLALGLVAMFWGLDGYFLRQERLFRKVYDAVRVKTDDSIDFSMNTRPFTQKVDSWFGVVWSGTLCWFYGVISVAILLIYFWPACLKI